MAWFRRSQIFSLCIIVNNRQQHSGDDLLLAAALAAAIGDQQYMVDVVGDGESAWSQVKMVEYDLMVLDLMLPKLDGISLCRRLRSFGHSQLILMLTDRDTSMDKVGGLDALADDYVVKPVDFFELFAPRHPQTW